ncbi:hypothetical protein CCR75_009494 [Bremia lactucae]|uniref:Uncharacterized protein n=1 Tax=Bremia lactucae TaxID=4779 RepID=A0A976FLV5_BRELC|nr:hypothetical protein CCR75_009494 [Bremia lactucae]
MRPKLKRPTSRRCFFLLLFFGFTLLACLVTFSLKTLTFTTTAKALNQVAAPPRILMEAKITSSAISRLKEWATPYLAKITSFWFVKYVAPSLYLRLASDKTAAIDTLFKLFQVDKDAPNLLQSKPFEKWYKAVLKAYKHNPQEGRRAMIKTLAQSFQDEARLSRVLAEAKESSSREPRAHAQLLEDALFDRWIHLHNKAARIAKARGLKISQGNDIAEAAYKLLKLDAAKSDFLSTVSLRTWFLYMNEAHVSFHVQHSFLLSKLRHANDSEELDRKLVDAISKGGLMSGIASDLMVASYKMRGLSIEDLLKRVKDEKQRDSIEIALLNAWVLAEYKTHLNVDTLMQNLLQHLSEQKLIDLIAKTNISRDYLDALKKGLVNLWQARHLTSFQVFKLLKLDVNIDEMAENPLLSLWVQSDTDIDFAAPWAGYFNVVKTFLVDIAKLETMIARAEKINDKTIKDFAEGMRDELKKRRKTTEK